MFRQNPVRKFPERRRHIRIVTIRNFGYCTIAFLLVFAAVTIRSEMRGRHMNEYGRLLGKQIEREIPQPKPVAVVEEAASPVQEEAPSYSYASSPPPMTDSTYSVEPVEPVTTQILPPSSRSSEGDIAIVGGPEGVSVVRQARRRPVLSGGFGRP